MQFAADLASDTKRFVKKAIAPQTERLTALEARVQQLESRPADVSYAGIYDAAKAYDQGVLVTRDGGLWLAIKATWGETPGRLRRLEIDRQIGPRPAGVMMLNDWLQLTPDNAAAVFDYLQREAWKTPSRGSTS